MVLKSKAALKAQPPVKVEEPVVASSSSSKLKKSPIRSGRTKSPARPISTARGKSPNRTKSPARKSPSRAKRDVSPPPLQSSTPKAQLVAARSPIRRSPGRKSPTRTTKSLGKTSESYFTEKVQRPRRAQLDVDTDSDNVDVDTAPVSEKPQAAVRGRARRLEVQIEKLNIKNAEPLQHSTFDVIKRITRNSQNREVERVVHLKHFDKITKKLAEFSDEDDVIPVRKSESVERISDFKQFSEFGGLWGALFLTFSLPLFAIGLYVTCNESQCSFVKHPNYRKYALVSTYFDLISALGFLGFIIILAVSSVVPFGGKKVSGIAINQSKFVYTMNGFSSFIILSGIAVALETRGIPVTGFIEKHLFHLLIISILFGIFVSIYAYIRSLYVPFSALNVHVVGKNRIYGFFMGREINPRLLGILDLKIYAYRLVLIGTLLLDFAHVYNGKVRPSSTQGPLDLKSGEITSTLVVLTLIRSIYYLDILSHESGAVTTFDVQYEGFGYLAIMASVLYPFMISTITKYVIDYNVNLAAWKLVLITIVFVFGYALFRSSNNQKDAFRKNPYNPALSHLETIPTTKGKKLICSGFWGVVRHPNYLGDILMNLAFIPFAPTVPPVLSVICVILFLIHRSVRDNVRCKQKYGAAWERYCNKVKYVLVPKVY